MDRIKKSRMDCFADIKLDEKINQIFRKKMWKKIFPCKSANAH